MRQVAACCYTCRFSHFPKRHMNRVSRTKGICLRNTPLDLPRTWLIPDEFWNLLKDDGFPVNDFDTFKTQCAGLLYGHAALTGHIAEQDLRTEYARLNAIARHWAEIESVSWLETCPDQLPQLAHTFLTETEEAHGRNKT